MQSYTKHTNLDSFDTNKHHIWPEQSIVVQKCNIKQRDISYNDFRIHSWRTGKGFFFSYICYVTKLDFHKVSQLLNLRDNVIIPTLNTPTVITPTLITPEVYPYISTWFNMEMMWWYSKFVRFLLNSELLKVILSSGETSKKDSFLFHKPF